MREYCPMEQHPIPQQISSYQFRLVGDMTLKQFFQLAAGALIALLLYTSPLHPILKWPLMIFFFALGAALAFLPFQERPLEKWIIAFFRSIYAPTSYSWQKLTVIPDYFQPETQATQPTSGNTKSPASNLPFLNNLEEAENVFLNKIGTLFNATPHPQTQTTSAPTPPVQPVNTPAPQPVINNEKIVISSQNIATNSVIQPSLPVVPNIPSSTQPVPVPVSTAHAPQPIHIPTPNPVEVKQTVIPTSTVAEVKAPPKLVIQEVGGPKPNIQIDSTHQVGQVFTAHPTQGQMAQFSSEAAPPSVPEHPNLVSGQVMDANGKIIEGAILEIRDDQSRPVRALKSNKAGHFMIVTPLLNGRYELIVEKDGFDFAPLVFETKGEIIQPIAIRSKNALQAEPVAQPMQQVTMNATVNTPLSGNIMTT